MKINTLEIMLGTQISRRAFRAGIWLTNAADRRAMEEGRKQAARIRATQKVSDEDIDACVAACKTMADEPSLAVLQSWRFLPDPPTVGSRFNSLDRSDRIRADRYR
jgi:hypothetical protein